jgi:hypothetical protein
MGFSNTAVCAEQPEILSHKTLKTPQKVSHISPTKTSACGCQQQQQQLPTASADV